MFGLAMASRQDNQPELLRVVIRLGTIVSGGVPELDAATADLIGAEMLARAEPILACVATAFRKQDFVLEAVHEQPIREPGYGTIISFPGQRARRGDLFVTSRTCVTVCFADRKSKIWTRFTAMRGAEQAFATTEVEELRREFSEMSSALHKELLAHYEEYFRASAHIADGSAIKLKPVGEILLVGADTEDPDVVEASALAEHRQLDLMSTEHRDDLVQALRLLGSKKRAKHEYFDFRSSSGAWGFFDQQLSGARAEIVGICVPTSTDDASTRRRVGAQQLTRAIADKYAAAF